MFDFKGCRNAAICVQPQHVDEANSVSPRDDVRNRPANRRSRGRTCASCERTSTVFGLIPFAEHMHVANGQVLSIRDYCDPRPMLGGMKTSA